ncbi:MAG TPA: PaaI family thioesterase [Thermoanaerobaculia bacterium]|nr:PaaI family thioesterase [Thermoanaerobaculia bacterium]
MTTIGARLTRVEPGAIEIELPFRADLLQQSGTLHAGVISSIADNACGYAALSLFPEGANVVSVDFTISFLAPVTGDIVARGRVLRSGKTLSFTAADVFAGETLVATMSATIMRR